MKRKHPFHRYFAKHGHYPRLRLDNGVQRLYIEFAPGYVHIKSSSPFSGEVYIVRSAWFTLLKRAVPITRKWAKHKDFDVPQRVSEAAAFEVELNRQRRAEKKARSQAETLEDAHRRERQRKRWLKAKARGKRRT